MARRVPRWAFMERFDVPSVDNPSELHFSRLRIVQTPWFGVYLHRFDNPDVRQLHDHPWPFVSIILRGGYEEARSYGPTDRAVRVRWFNAKRSTDLHYIARLLRRPTWTLIFVGARVRTWGYVDPDGTWTRFDLHPNAAKFDAAVAARAALTDSEDDDA